MTSREIKQTATNIKQARLLKGLTQIELAEKAGINANAYAKIERGESDPTLATIKKICKALCMKASDILGY